MRILNENILECIEMKTTYQNKHTSTITYVMYHGPEVQTPGRVKVKWSICSHNREKKSHKIYVTTFNRVQT